MFVQSEKFVLTHGGRAGDLSIYGQESINTTWRLNSSTRRRSPCACGFWPDLPNASYLGFTGTPIELGDKNTRSVFGDYIDIYDISRAVEDGATVKIYYEGRLAKLELNADERPKIDEEFEEISEREEPSAKERLKTKWAALEKLVGRVKRIELVAQDIVNHWEERLTELTKAFALVATHDSAVKIREEVAFFQCLRAQCAKLGAGGGPTQEDLDAAVRQIISRSVASDEMLDIFAAAATERPDISMRSDEFLAEVRDMPQRNFALEVNDSAVKVLGDETLRDIARELAESVRRNVTIDWTVNESVRAKLRVLAKRILKKYGYPPDKQAQATETVLKQAELLCADWAA